MMDSHVLRKAAWRLPALADLAVLRFNTRGTTSVRGTSEGAFDGGDGRAVRRGRRDRVRRVRRAAADLAGRLVVRLRPGAALRQRPGVSSGAILLSPPLRAATEEDLAAWAAVGQAADRAGAGVRRLPAPGRGRSSGSPPIRQAEVVGVPGAKHLWVGDAETVLDEIVKRVAPAGVPVAERVGRSR